VRRSALAFSVLAVIALTAVGGCGGGNDDDSAIHIDSITPSSGTIGDEIVIQGRGFDASNNDIGFYPSGVSGWGDSSFITHVPSDDGKTLRFVLQDTLGACAESQTGGCDDVGLPLPPGNLMVAVYTAVGTSNRVAFTREGGTPVELARTEVFSSPDFLRLKAMLDDVVAASLESPTAGWALTSYYFSVLESPGREITIQLTVRAIDIESLPGDVPGEIEGYPLTVRVLE